MARLLTRQWSARCWWGARGRGRTPTTCRWGGGLSQHVVSQSGRQADSDRLSFRQSLRQALGKSSATQSVRRRSLHQSVSQSLSQLVIHVTRRLSGVTMLKLVSIYSESGCRALRQTNGRSAFFFFPSSFFHRWMAGHPPTTTWPRKYILVATCATVATARASPGAIRWSHALSPASHARLLLSRDPTLRLRLNRRCHPAGKSGGHPPRRRCRLRLAWCQAAV